MQRSWGYMSMVGFPRNRPQVADFSSRDEFECETARYPCSGVFSWRKLLKLLGVLKPTLHVCIPNIYQSAPPSQCGVNYLCHCITAQQWNSTKCFCLGNQPLHKWEIMWLPLTWTKFIEKWRGQLDSWPEVSCRFYHQCTLQFLF